MCEISSDQMRSRLAAIAGSSYRAVTGSRREAARRGLASVSAGRTADPDVHAKERESEVKPAVFSGEPEVHGSSELAVLDQANHSNSKRLHDEIRFKFYTHEFFLSCLILINTNFAVFCAVIDSAHEDQHRMNVDKHSFRVHSCMDLFHIRCTLHVSTE